MPTLKEILTAAPTIASIEETALGILKTIGLDATAWQKFSLPRTLFKLTAELYLSSKRGITNIALSRLRKGNGGAALTAVAKRFFGLDRNTAVATVGEVAIDDDGGAPVDIEVGDITVRDAATGKLYRNVARGSVTVGGSLTLAFKADQPGSAYNIATNSLLQRTIGPIGLAFSNPPIAGSDTWITTLGANEETDGDLDDRCVARWETDLNDDERYKRAITAVIPDITKVQLYDDIPGDLVFVLATDIGIPTGDQVAAALALIHRIRPKGLHAVQVTAATLQPLAVIATVDVQTEHAGAYLAALEALRTAYQKEIYPGDKVYVSRLHSILHAPIGVKRVDLTSPGIDTPAADFDFVIVLDFSGVTVRVVA